MFELVNTTPGLDLSCTIIAVCVGVAAASYEAMRSAKMRRAKMTSPRRKTGRMMVVPALPRLAARWF